MTSSGPRRGGTSPGTPPAKPIPRVGVVETVRWLLRRRRRFRVTGRSMWPLLEPDDEVLVRPNQAISVGDIVVTRHPHRLDVHLVKRVVGIDDVGRLRLAGENPDESTDSRTLGTVPRDLVIGTVTSRF